MRLADERGFTLIETLVTVAIVATVVGGITTLFVSGTRAQNELSQRFQGQNEARSALDRLRRDVVCASAASGSSTSVTLTVPAGCVAQGSVTWCTASGGSPARYRLFRLAGSGTCATQGRLYVDWLTTGAVFTLQPQSLASLAKLRAHLPVQLQRMDAPYELCDVVVLRNSSRIGATSTVAPPC
ncbi:MAG: prepilin-type N-terminal cleavage/methylation domain-containing protein [Gaiellaceae bacterium]